MWNVINICIFLSERWHYNLFWKVQKMSNRTWLTKLVMENYIDFAFHFNKGLKVRQICLILKKIVNNKYYRFVMSKWSNFSSLSKSVQLTILTKSSELFVDMEPSVLNQTSQFLRFAIWRVSLKFSNFFDKFVYFCLLWSFKCFA